MSDGSLHSVGVSEVSGDGLRSGSEGAQCSSGPMASQVLGLDDIVFGPGSDDGASSCARWPSEEALEDQQGFGPTDLEGSDGSAPDHRAELLGPLTLAPESLVLRVV